MPVLSNRKGITGSSYCDSNAGTFSQMLLYHISKAVLCDEQSLKYQQPIK